MHLIVSFCGRFTASQQVYTMLMLPGKLSLYYKREWVYIIMFLNKISKEKFLWNSIYFLTLHALHIMPITNLAQINMNYE